MMGMGAERGNVTLITAFTMLLLVMIVILGAGLSDTASRSTRMQAGSDDAAVTAAASYIAVINDEVLLEEVDWGLGFVQRMAELLSEIGGVIAAIPFLEAIGGAIEAAADFVQSAVESMQNVFDDAIKDPLDAVLDVAKSVLGVVNATIAAANNGYLGFMVPSGTLKQGLTAAKPPQYDLAYVLKRVEHSLRLVYPLNGDGTPNTNNKDNNVDLMGAIQEISIHAIWGKGSQASLPPPQGGGQPPPCPPKVSCSNPNAESRLGGGTATPDPGRDTFHLWPTTPGCVDPQEFPYKNPYTEYDPTQFAPTGQQWHRPCDEKAWLQQLLQTYYWKEWKSLQDVYNQLFTVADPKNPKNRIFDPAKNGTFVDHNPNGSFPTFQSDTKIAVNLIQDAQNQLQNVAEGNGKKGDYGQIGRPTDAPATNCGDSHATFFARVNEGCYDNWQSANCPDAARGHGNQNYFNFSCNGTIKYSGSGSIPHAIAELICDKPPAGQADGCHLVWGLPGPDQNNPDQKTLSPTYAPLPTGFATDYRASKVQRDELSPYSQALSMWKQETFDCANQTKGQQPQNGCPSAGTEATGDTEEDFISTSVIKPDAMTSLAASFSHQPTPATRYSITASRVQIHRAKSIKDAVHVSDLCSRIFSHTGARDNYPTVLGFLPTDGYGWCYVLLSAFDTFAAIYTAIQGFFNPVINFLQHTLCLPTPFGDICPFGWVGDILQGLLNYLLGPAPPDGRTFHISLTTVACVPALATAADIAQHPEHLLAAVASMESTTDDSGGTCGGGNPGGGA